MLGPERVPCPRCLFKVHPIALDAPSGLCSSCDLALLEQQWAKARAAKAEGIERADRAARIEKRAQIDAAIRQIAARGRPFSANDLRHLVPNAGPLMGARFNAAAKAGFIKRIGYVPSTDEGTHAHPIAQWMPCHT